MWQYQNTDELYNHGVLGMRWGVRKVRSSSSSNKKRKHRMSNRAYKKYRSSSRDSKIAQNIKRKKLYQMSNEDLKTVNYRQQLEYQYKQNNPNTSKKILLGIGATAGAIGAINTLYKNSDTLIKTGKKLFTKILK